MLAFMSHELKTEWYFD